MTVLVEQIAELHFDALGVDLDPGRPRPLPQRHTGLDDQAKQLLTTSENSPGRHEPWSGPSRTPAPARPAVIAVVTEHTTARAPRALLWQPPAPATSKSMPDVESIPPGGVARTIQCAVGRRARLDGRREPLVRMRARRRELPVPWRQTSSITSTVDAAAEAGEVVGAQRPAGHRNLAQAYLAQAIDGSSDQGGFGI